MFKEAKNIFVTLTYRCNAYCTKCMTRYHEKKHLEMSSEVFERILFLLKKNEFKGIISMGAGESLLYHDFYNVAKSILAVNDQVRLRVLSNGMIFRADNPNVLFSDRCTWGITMDGFYQESIDAVQKGVDIEQVKANIALIKSTQQNAKMYLNYTMYGTNLDEMLPFAKFAVQNGIYDIFFTKLKVFEGFEDDLRDYRLIQNSNYESACAEVIEYLRSCNIECYGLLDTPRQTNCFSRNAASPIIDVDGSVTLCSGREDTYIGNIMDDDIEEKWENAAGILKNNCRHWCGKCGDVMLPNGCYPLPKTIKKGK